MPATTTLPRLTEHAYTRPLAVMGALAATFAVWLVAHPLGGADLTVRSGVDLQQVGPAAVALVTLIAGLGAWGLLSALEHVARRPRRTWTILASAALAVSLLGPIFLGRTSATTAALLSMHLAAAGVLIPTLARSARTRAATV